MRKYSFIQQNIGLVTNKSKITFMTTSTGMSAYLKNNQDITSPKVTITAVISVKPVAVHKRDAFKILMFMNDNKNR